ncbi:MAG: hypothetical protein ACRETD_09605, partial [Steroidobacteraceae bacterium]
MTRMFNFRATIAGCATLQRARSALAALLLAAALGLAGPQAPAAAATSPATAPLVQQSDITYLGAFALPSWANGAIGTSSFEYGGHALTAYTDPATGASTLFMEGHAQQPGNVAQVQIPATLAQSSNWSALPVAKVLQPFAGITDGLLNMIDPTNV